MIWLAPRQDIMAEEHGRKKRCFVYGNWEAKRVTEPKKRGAGDRYSAQGLITMTCLDTPELCFTNPLAAPEPVQLKIHLNCHTESISLS